MRELSNLEIKAANATINNWNTRFDTIPKEAIAGTGISRIDAPKITQPKAPAQAPQVGTVEAGYRFKGGNPSDPNSWEKVK